MIKRVWNDNYCVYGAPKVWRQMNRESIRVARFTVERLMRQMGLQGVVRGKKVRTTIPDAGAPCPMDKVNRNFRAPAPNRRRGETRTPCVRVSVERLHLCLDLGRVCLCGVHD